MRVRVIVASLVVACCAPALRAQNFDHPGKVFVDKLGWLTPEEAVAKNCFEYRRRWFAADMKRRLDAWQKEDSAHATWADARTLRTKHYRVQSDVPRFILELEIEPFLDQLYDTYVRVFREQFGLSSRAANQKLIKIYASYDEYRSHEADGDGPPPRSNPAFIVNGCELVCFYDETDPGNFYASVFHEGAHQFMQAVLPGAQFPIWLDEAMATYFEGCTWSRATKQVSISFLPPDRLDCAQEILKKASPQQENLAGPLFSDVPQARFEATNYALAWSFVRYLLQRDDGRFRKRFASFLEAMNGAGTRPLAEVFKRTMGVEFAEMARGWPAAVLQWKLPTAPVWSVTGIDAPDAAVDLRDGDLIWEIDGVVPADPDEASKAWAARPKDRPCEVTVVRRTKVAGPDQYTSGFVSIAVPPTSPLKLSWNRVLDRAYSLRD